MTNWKAFRRKYWQTANRQKLKSYYYQYVWRTAETLEEHFYHLQPGIESELGRHHSKSPSLFNTLKLGPDAFKAWKPQLVEWPKP